MERGAMRDGIASLLWALAWAGVGLSRPFHLDGGFILAGAAATFETPLSPYRETLQFMGHEWPGRLWNHPPFFHYYLAPVAGWFWEHRVLATHVALLPFVVGLWLGLRWMRGWWRGDGLFWACPVTLVMLQVETWEVPTLACCVLALGLMVRAAEERWRAGWVWSAVAAASALMLTYHAARLLVVMAVLGRMLGLSWRGVALLLGGSALPVAVWQAVSWMWWGVPHVAIGLSSDMARFIWPIQSKMKPWNALTTLAGLGALTLPAVFLSSAKRPKPGSSFAAPCEAEGASPLPGFGAEPQAGLRAELRTELRAELRQGRGSAPSPRQGLRPWTPWVFGGLLFLGGWGGMAAWCGLGGYGLALALGEAWRRRGEPAARLWSAWLALELAFCVGLAPFGSARYILPLALPLAFFWRGSGAGWKILALNACWGAMIVGAEREEVAAYDQAPRLFQSLPAPVGRSFFVGEWSFHTSMQEAGHQYLLYDEPLRAGDRILRPRKLTSELWGLNAHLLEGVEPVLTSTIEARPSLPLRLNDPELGAGFWWSGAGLLPLAFGRSCIERFEVYDVRRLPAWLAEVAAGDPAAARLAAARFEDGLPRVAIFLHPPGVLRFERPPAPGVWRLGAGIHPDAGGVGDGATLRLSSEGGVLLDTTIRPGAWTEFEIPAAAGPITVEAGPGPGGDFRFDWLCFRPL